VINHLALAVTNEERSRAFYEAYLGFGDPERMEDGVLMLHADGFRLALGPAEEPPSLPAFLHFGRGVEDAGEVRAAAERFAADGVEVVSQHEEEDYVSVKVRDPDGYVVEIAWDA
jgi:catechol 2,3-dioxygenase-like lactoylglutathione lyase family enzyme